jgi:hypothetical protein
MSKQNEPAFPVVFTDQVYGKDGESSTDTYSAGGMTLRDWFAAHASEIDILSIMGESVPGRTIDRFEARYKYADRMIAERDK